MLTVRYFAGARKAAGTAEEKIEARNLAELVEVLEREHGEPLGRVLGAASYLVDEVAWRDRLAPLPTGATVDVLPPFAGG